MLYKLLNLGCGETVTIYLPGMVCEKVKVKEVSYDSVTVISQEGRSLELDKGAIEQIMRHFTAWNMLKVFLNFICGAAVIFIPDCVTMVFSLLFIEQAMKSTDPWYLYVLAYFTFYVSAIFSLKQLWEHDIISIYNRNNL